MSLPSPTSPQEGLRRRGKQSIDDSWSNQASTSKQPISPTSHQRFPSSTSDSFGDFVDSNDREVEEYSPANAPISVDTDDDWQDADFVQQFSPVTTAQNDALQRDIEVPPLSKGPSTVLNALDWDAWETPRGPTPQPDASKGAPSIMDDSFFAAFEQATVSQQQRPSPPIIDLRQMEKKLDEQKQAKQRLNSNELDFFESFEKGPKQAMIDSREKAGKDSSLKGTQLDNMLDAQASPLNIVTPGSKGQAALDYFGSNSQGLMRDSPISKDPTNANNGKDEISLSPRSGSWSETAGHWAGTFRKTLGTLRGQAAEFAQHLPSSKDFIVPEGEEEEEEEEEDNSDREDAENGHHAEASDEVKSPTRRIVKAADYSQSTPFGTGNGASPASPPIYHHHQRFGSGGIPALHAPIRGAPGFDPNPVHNWNTGSWSLTSSEETQRNKKPIPVQLKGRRDETQDVIGEELAAQLTGQLPKRLQLGKTWKLLYSSDQHGISLGTLYWKVQSGLDMDKRGQKGEYAGVSEAEGWLRGASQATQEAITGVRRIGGGLNLTDAGLILAIRDSEDQIFGAFVNERLRAQTSYYGNGECFLWKTTSGSEIKTFKWTGRNDYMVLTEAHYLSFGGGDGKYGLWLDGQLEKGISSKCPAFDNEVLCTLAGSEQEGHFECITLEVWACGID